MLLTSDVDSTLSVRSPVIDIEPSNSENKASKIITH